MGEPIRWSISVDKETDAIAEILQRTYAEYVGSNRSRLVQFLFKRFHRMAGNVAAALEQQQGINQAILSEEITTLNNLSQVSAAFPGEQKKPLVRVGPSKTGSHQRREFAFSGSTAVSANVAFVTSRIHSTRVSGVAA